MIRTLLGVLVGGIVGTAFGFAAAIFAFPYLFPPPPAAETLTLADNDEVVAVGTFIHANPSDPIHYGSGGVEVYNEAVFLKEDFKVGPGPAFHVYLVPSEEIRSSSDVRNTMYIDLGKLRSFEGSQQYAIPGGVDVADYPSVVIWCKQFGVLISPADLDFNI